MDLHQKPSGNTCDFKISITFPEFTMVYYGLLQFSMVYCGLSSLIHNHKLIKKQVFPAAKHIRFFPKLLPQATLLEAHAPLAQLHNCPANLITAPWEQQLLLRGFARDAPTMWLLEGLLVRCQKRHGERKTTNQKKWG